MRSTTSVRRTLLHPTVTYPHYSGLVSSNTTTDFPERQSTISVLQFKVGMEHVFWTQNFLINPRMLPFEKLMRMVPIRLPDDMRFSKLKTQFKS
ncbi:hypothetical protein TNCV_3108621 [Trichonephila clavipes]|uniref:Uncharacterized protein n=1 Tax=Trichonephila clavipes TaxID=2585209 RepID=A0A8X6SFT6_TRICX|nr:hypothetical protein TNCV_3108621 [Trichonephila clavipes]